MSLRFSIASMMLDEPCIQLLSCSLQSTEEMPNVRCLKFVPCLFTSSRWLVAG
jgi:hypothetical protein